MRSRRDKLKEIGQKCKEYREQLGYKQLNIARRIGCTPENISAFERGLNNNAIILSWYIEHGMRLL